MMNRKSTRSRSNSPASSVDSSTNRKRSNNKKKNSKACKTKQDVQVFTSLPPKVEGEIKCYLKMQITKINIFSNNETKPENLKPNQKITLNKNTHQTKPKIENIIAKCVWWGEDNPNGALFRPKILGNSNQDPKSIQTTAKYMVRSGPKQFSAYLNDMKTLDVDLFDASNMNLIGKVQIHEIGHLTANNPIKGFYSAFDSSQAKIAEVYLSLQFESLYQDSVDNCADKSDNSRPVTPTSASNMNEFYSKYEQFEKNQQKLYDNTNLFNSNSYANTLNEDISFKTNHKNPIISNLIERGLKLKQEMIKSTSNPNLTSDVYLKPIHTSTQKNSKNQNLYSFLNESKLNFEYLEDSDSALKDELNDDESRLSDPLHDPQLLSALIYDHNETSVKQLTDEDQELKNLLQPPDLLSRFLNKTNNYLNLETNSHKPIKLVEEPVKKNFNLRNRSLSRSSLSSSNLSEDEVDSRSNQTRVSFELQSSDGESSICNENCFDILSSQRISLLNLIQVAKLKIDKLNFFSNISIQNLAEHINKMESLSQSQKSTNSKTKPPLASKRIDFGQLFFVEYQFPVIASSRDSLAQLSVNPIATQVMRVVSKRVKKQDENTNLNEDQIYFDHNADYSVLFNSHLLESWWKSYILFKIYFRQPLINNQFSNPYLIGYSRLSLKNVLKSKNFKLLKKLAVYDQFNETGLNSFNNKKRIGTLHVSLELSSDLKEFSINLAKLKNSEEKIRPKQILKKPSVFVSSVPKKIEAKPSVQNTDIIKFNNKPDINNFNIIEETSFPIQIYLSINEARGFNNLSSNVSNIYLICRLFWNKEKVKFDDLKSSNLTLNLSFMIKQSIIDNMRNNYMIIEAWCKKNLQCDSLIGTIKLPLHEFYLKTNDLVYLKEHLKDTSKNPIIGVDGWISAFDPFTGSKTGEINVLFAMGSSEQILNLQKILFDKSKLAKKEPIINQTKFKMNEHYLTIIIDKLKINPIESSKNEIVLDDVDFYVKYKFPSRLDNKEFDIFQIATKHNSSNFSYKQEHKILLANDLSIQNELMNLFKNENNSCILFKIWSKSNQINLKDRLIGYGELPIEKLISIINNQETSLSVNNRSFIVPLVTYENYSNSYKSEKCIGQMFLTIEYKNESNFSTPSHESNSIISLPQKKPQNSNNVMINIGILRANGLKNALVKIMSENNSSLFCLENSNIYVKFSLNFLNKPHDFKQTRLISSSLSGYTPEFFDYFDIECPLVSKYNSNNKKTISLAEQLEMGQIVFEIWSKFIDIYNKNSSDVLLGTCAVILEPLLENRIGIRGWIPVRSISTGHFLDNLIEDQNSAGNIELAIRFTKSDDYLKVIQTGKEIGWIRASDLEFENNNTNLNTDLVIHQPVQENINKNLDKDLIPQKDFNTSTKLKCLIEIEKAIHLPKVYDEKLNKHFEPNAFVSFNANLENLSETIQTKICEQKSSPIWNFQLLFQIDSVYFLEESKYFILKVWHKYILGNDYDPWTSSNKLLGHVSVDLQPLIYGLSHLSGWYNIQDSVGNCQGQLKINFFPQENLSKIKEIYLKRKKLKTSNTETEKRISFINLNQNIFESSSQNSLNSINKTSSLTFNSDKSSTNSKQTSIEPSLTKEDILKDKNDLKNGLIEKLNELDQLNKLLKERLEKKSFNSIKTEIETKNFEPIKIQTKILPEPELKPEPETNILIIPEEEQLEDKIEPQDHKAILDKLNSKQELIKNSSLIDSFWASTIVSDSKSEKSFNGGNLETLKSINSDQIENIEIDLDKNFENLNIIEDENAKKCVSENLNDTDLDQTFNLNNSYEIVPNRNSNNASPVIDTFDFVDKIIDCTKLDSKEDQEDLNTNHKPDENYTSIFINDHLENQNYDDDFENNENLTVIVPAELNKIANQHIEQEQIENRVEIDSEKENDDENELKLEIQNELLIEDKTEKSDSAPNEKLKNLSSRIPNYFLPQEDLEKSMKRLHYNYIKINSDDKEEKEADNESDDTKSSKVKLKSTTLLIQNQKALKQDLSRINKIFHSKFN